MVYTGTEPQNTKNIQKLPFKIIRIVLWRKLLKNTLIIKKNDSTLKSGKIGHFAKAIAKQNGQWSFILGRNFKKPKAYKNDFAITLQYFYAKIS